jgi:hypothetical protein
MVIKKAVTAHKNSTPEKVGTSRRMKRKVTHEPEVPDKIPAPPLTFAHFQRLDCLTTG